MDKSSGILETLARLETLSPAGYAMALHVSFTTPRFLFQKYNRDWIEYYTKNGLVMADPTVRWGFENNGLISWSELTDLDTEGVLKKASEFGIKHGFTFSTEAGDSKSITSFARGDRAFSDEERQEICKLAEALHHETADLDALSGSDLEALKKMSVLFTHGQ